ncbi:MAG: DUF1295 domain-containing protein [Clostridia bacterium]|nr:DUF1295 domain-containing protein [Clostridia bacterium]
MIKSLKQSRGKSFVVLLFVYIIATVVGVIVYRALPLSWWLALLIADAAATVTTFLFSLLFGNASVYDPYWSVQPPVILVAFAWGRELTAFGVLLLAAVFFWAIRLTANWAYTFGGLCHQDWRYTMLHERTGKFYPVVNLVGIHMVPTLVVYGCVLPAVYAIRESVSLTLPAALCLSLSLAAASMQGVADIQMHKFRKNRDAAFNRHGLWKYSRHPNYLGEILMWWGVALAVAFCDPSAWILAFGALANTALFLFVSIPLAEGRQAKKQGFATYKQETRMLLPVKK